MEDNIAFLALLIRHIEACVDALSVHHCCRRLGTWSDVKHRHFSTNAALSSFKEPGTEQFRFYPPIAVIVFLLLDHQSYNDNESVPLGTLANLVAVLTASLSYYLTAM